MSIEDGRPEVIVPTWGQTWHSAWKPFLPLNIVIFLLLWAGAYALGGPVASIVAPVVVVGAVLALGRYATWRVRIRVSGYGIEVLRGRRAIGIRWADVERVAILTKHGGPVLGPYGLPVAVAAGSLSGYENANTGPGLIGQGASARGTGPEALATPRPLGKTLLTLFSVDRRWTTGQVGAWVRAYRPDLLADTEAASTS